MKYMTRILTTLLFAGLFISLNTIETKLKDGYYTSSHGHATVLYKIEGDNIEWYRDNVIKSWGQGKYEIIQTDSVMKISLSKLKTSRQGEFEGTDFDYSIDISWDNEEKLFKIKGYRFTDNFAIIDDLKKRVKSSCKIRVERPSR
jgi:hypothetical protein